MSDRYKFTKEELLKRFKGKYINTYVYHYDRKDENGNWIPLYEVRSVSKTIKENHNLPEDCLIKE